MPDVIISLTTIPPRMAKLFQTLDSLQAQTTEVASIIVWLPRQYRRRDFDNYRIPEVPKGVEIRFCDTDYGPATKVLPAVQHYRGEDVRIIYCDDDEIYAPDWAEFLVRESQRFPDSGLSVSGMTVRKIEHLHFRTTAAFRIRCILTADLYRKWHHRSLDGQRAGVGPIDICQGFSGVLIKPDFLPDTAFDIPDKLWMVDDVWLSGQMIANGVSLRRSSETKMCIKSDSAGISDLTSMVHDGYDRINADMYAVNYFREKYGIWK